MKSIFYGAVAASALLWHASSYANASVSTGETAVDNGVRVSLSTSSSSLLLFNPVAWIFDEALSWSGQSGLTAIAPATLQTFWRRYGSSLFWMDVTAPISGLTFSGQANGSAHIESLQTSGGFQVVSMSDQYTTSGGSLQISNLRFDTASKSVYADLSGGNGASSLSGMHLFTYGSAYDSLDLPNGVTTNHNITFVGLSLTQGAMAYFLQSLGIMTLTMADLLKDGYGGPSGGLKVSLTTEVTAVPEPSGYALLSASLAMAFIAVRKRAPKPRA